MANRVNIRPIENSDMEWARKLRNEHRTAFVYQDVITQAQQQEWFYNYQERDRAEYTFFVVEVGGERIGTTSYRRYDETRFELGNNIIDTPYQGKGYFSEVYHSVKEWLADAPIVATVLDDNQHMLDVYHRLGFQDLGYVEKGVLLLGD